MTVAVGQQLCDPCDSSTLSCDSDLVCSTDTYRCECPPGYVQIGNTCCNYHFFSCLSMLFFFLFKSTQNLQCRRAAYFVIYAHLSIWRQENSTKVVDKVDIIFTGSSNYHIETKRQQWFCYEISYWRFYNNLKWCEALSEFQVWLSLWRHLIRTLVLFCSSRYTFQAPPSCNYTFLVPPSSQYDILWQITWPNLS